jgi:hypothetical protein
VANNRVLRLDPKPCPFRLHLLSLHVLVLRKSVVKLLHGCDSDNGDVSIFILEKFFSFQSIPILRFRVMAPQTLPEFIRENHIPEILSWVYTLRPQQVDLLQIAKAGGSILQSADHGHDRKVSSDDIREGWWGAGTMAQLCEVNHEFFDHCHFAGDMTLALLKKYVQDVLILHQEYILRGVEVYRAAKIRLEGASVIFQGKFSRFVRNMEQDRMVYSFCEALYPFIRFCVSSHDVYDSRAGEGIFPNIASYFGWKVGEL